MQRNLILVINIALVILLLVGLVGCKSKRGYDEDSMHAANTLSMASGSGSAEIIPGRGTRKIDLAVIIFEAAAEFDAKHGAFAHVSKEKREQFRDELWEIIKSAVGPYGNPLYKAVNKEQFDREFEVAFPFKDADGDGIHDYFDDTPDGDVNEDGTVDW